MCAIFQSYPKKSQLTFVKWIFRYIKGTIKFDLFYDKSFEYKLVTFCGAYCVLNRIERKCTSGSGRCQFISNHSMITLNPFEFSAKRVELLWFKTTSIMISSVPFRITHILI